MQAISIQMNISSRNSIGSFGRFADSIMQCFFFLWALQVLKWPIIICNHDAVRILLYYITKNVYFVQSNVAVFMLCETIQDFIEVLRFDSLSDVTHCLNVLLFVSICLFNSLVYVCSQQICSSAYFSKHFYRLHYYVRMCQTVT